MGLGPEDILEMPDNTELKLPVFIFSVLSDKGKVPVCQLLYKFNNCDLCPRLCSNGALSPEATNIWLRASEESYPVARPGTHTYCISSR